MSFYYQLNDTCHSKTVIFEPPIDVIPNRGIRRSTRRTKNKKVTIQVPAPQSKARGKKRQATHPPNADPPTLAMIQPPTKRLRSAPIAATTTVSHF